MRFPIPSLRRISKEAVESSMRSLECSFPLGKFLGALLLHSLKRNILSASLLSFDGPSAGNKIENKVIMALVSVELEEWWGDWT
jgi:hypothetical protein